MEDVFAGNLWSEEGMGEPMTLWMEVFATITRDRFDPALAPSRLCG